MESSWDYVTKWYLVGINGLLFMNSPILQFVVNVAGIGLIYSISNK